MNTLDSRLYRHPIPLITLALGLALLVLFGTTAHAQAQSHEAFRGNDNGYEIIVNLQPIKPVVGTVHFSVLPLDANTGQPVQNAIVTIFASDELSGDLFRTPALSSPRFPSFYESNFKFKSEGTWNLRIEIESDELGSGEVSFPLEIGPQAFAPTNVGGTIFFFGLVAVLFGGVFYVWYSIRRQSRARVAQT